MVGNDGFVRVSLAAEWRDPMTRSMSLLALLIAGGCATAPAPSSELGEAAVIPFVKRDGILEWVAAAPEQVYLRGPSGDWFLVRTMGPCRINSATTLGFETTGADQLDRHGAILAEGFRCPIESITRSEAPPEVRRRA